MTVPDVFAALSVAGFDFPRSDLPANVRYVGLLSPRASSDWAAPAWWEELDTNRPVVAVTQGTSNNSNLGDLVEPTLRALADHDVLVVAATGREDGAIRGPIPDNARVTSFIPFNELLPRCSLLITNGGYGGTQQALAAGIPVVVAGLGEDKPMTAARVAFHRLGMDLGTDTPEVPQIREAVSQVLNSSEIADRVSRIAREYQAHDAREGIHSLLGTSPDLAQRES